MITISNKTFHLSGKSISYIMTVSEQGQLLHYHFGKKIRSKEYLTTLPTWSSWGVSLDGVSMQMLEQEYPSYGYTDLRSPAFDVKNKDGNRISNLIYKSHKIIDGKPSLEGLPAVFANNNNAQTLEINLTDSVTGLLVVLSYTVFDDYDVICRNARFTNLKNDVLTINSAYSANVDFINSNKDVIYLTGEWGRERDIERKSLSQGMKLEISNARGASGHQINPFVMLCEKSATEHHGEAYGFSLVYSGNHSTVIEVDPFNSTRIHMGLNPQGFEWTLKKGETFQTPECVMAFSDDGIGGVSRQYHDLYRNNLCKSKWQHKKRPILINNWEGTYFNFTEEKLLSMAMRAKEAGIELFVLDDGWFGNRDNDRCSLGDWYVNTAKLPRGIDGLAKKINDIGLEFGLWFEPEMVNPDSDLYRSHPDWAISVPNRVPALSRWQYILDLSRKEVCDYIIDSVSKILGSANISYVKWDMNRYMTDMPYDGYNHKYILGMYYITDQITSRFPDVLFEGCSSGGGRFDPGILHYMPQIWTSDNSDAISRLKIQYGTSMCYPISSISAHVTASPNHQVGRDTSLKTRADVAYAGVFGYELDITTFSDIDFEIIKKQVEQYKQLREFVLDGDFYRLESPFDGNICSWEVVSKNKDKVFLFSCQVLKETLRKDPLLRLKGLDVSATYKDMETGACFGADELSNYGIFINYQLGDYQTVIKIFERV